MPPGCIWRRDRRDARPQPDLIPSLFGSPHDLFCEPREERSHGWIFDDDAQLLGSRLMLYSNLWAEMPGELCPRAAEIVSWEGSTYWE